MYFSIKKIKFFTQISCTGTSLIFACKAMPGANSLSVGTVKCSTVVFRLTHKNKTRLKKPAEEKQSSLFVQRKYR